MLLKLKFLKKNITYKVLIISSILNPFFSLNLLRNNLAVFGEETVLQQNKIKWEKLEINNGEFNNPNIIWKIYDELESEDNPSDIEINKKQKGFEINKFNNISTAKSISSLNRSIVFDDKKVGPDISFLNPIGFKSFNENFIDISIRGWNRRPKNSKLFQWNGGDAVGQIFYQFHHKEDSSFGLSLGVRSLYQGGLSGGGTNFGEGISSGFRWDYKLSNLLGLAIGAEQLFQFDDRTDTGRDIYVSISKAFLNTNKEKIFPFFVASGGVGTGYFALWRQTQFACTDLFDGAAVDINKYHRLCWGPFGTLSLLLNEKIATFIEYNNYSFMVGASLVPVQRLRLTAGATLAESFDDYKLKKLDEIRLYGRFSFAF